MALSPATSPRPTSDYSENFYLADPVTDVTIRDSASAKLCYPLVDYYPHPLLPSFCQHNTPTLFCESSRSSPSPSRKTWCSGLDSETTLLLYMLPDDH